MSEFLTKQVNSRADRLVSFNLADFQVPQGNEEEWRFTPIEKITDFFAAQTPGAHYTVEVTGDVEYAEVERDDSRLGKVLPPDDRVGALAWENFQKAHVVTLLRDVRLSSEAVVKIHGNNDSEISACELLVDAQPFAEGTVVIEHTGVARFAEGIEVRVADGAHLTLVTIQDWDDPAAHTLSNRIRVGKDATFKHIVVTLGGEIVRVTTNVDFTGPGGDVELLGAYFVDSQQHLEHRLLVDHNHPKCRSNATYKGALQGEGAHSVWIGDVLIEPNAEGTDTYELNRNLILTPGAKADSVPNLEIETGEIEGAGHASATGRFDDEQLFYLKSRGIPEDEARRLVVRGFFAELINQIGVESVQEKLIAAIDKELAITMGSNNGK
ncbi:Fe-S cluster assembly protein SufD [Arcanobacterium hippocoleae]|uniref:Fe-S cluster assembly protein SufD n=1 Tax=Arcanobacterium hippocoleae TaxID=149017 RepID=A0ABU1SZR1_9ACTO|nr:Fe-S cluster assembly protein SufD [Arcanobacterium hippocoleae]MDR6938612.1 Fe-S cluster assembly protein SufD [Arcanobacterium hippocoleae]